MNAFFVSTFRCLPTRIATGLLIACAALSGVASAQTVAAPPKLVVVLVVDGLPQRQMTAYPEQLAPDGFARFLNRGAWFSNARYGHAHTVTAPGHATLLTGASPDRTGIIGNDWRDPLTGAVVYSVGDTAARYIGHTTQPLDGTSPRNLKVDSVGDVLRQARPAARVIAISGKDRSAILPAGKSGVAYIYMPASGQFASTTHYMKEHPGWVNDFNAGRPADRYFKAEWKPLLPEAAYAQSVPDDQPWFGRGGGRLPLTVGAGPATAPNPGFYASLLLSPFGDMLALDFARAAIAGERLGGGDVTDLLTVSLSGHDYVNHAWGAESRLSHDHFLQLDRMLQTFFRDLDASVGAGNYLAVLTSDHGFMPPPEMAAARGLSSGRINQPQLIGRINAGLVQRYGEGRMLIGTSGSSLLLDRRVLAQKNLELDDVAEEARRLLLAETGIDTAYTRRELQSGSRSGDPWFTALRKSWHPDVSGDIQFSLKPYWMFGGAVTTHGSPHEYDAHVPLMLWGPSWLRPGRVDARVEMVDLAPTLASFIGVPPPPTSEGKPLPLPTP